MRPEGEHTPVGKIVSERLAFDSLFYKVIERTVETPDGVLREPQLLQDQADKSFAAAVVVTEEGNILFVREPKYGQMNHFLVIPTGGIKKGESPEQAAERETLEETGYQAENFTVINPRIVSKPDKLDGGEHSILVAEKAKKVQEPEKFRQVLELSREQVEKLLDEELENLQLEVDISRLAIFEALRHLKKLEQGKDFILELAKKTAELVSNLDPSIEPYQLFSKDVRGKNSPLEDWDEFIKNLPDNKKHVVTRPMLSLFRNQKLYGGGTSTLAAVYVPTHADLVKTKGVGKRMADFTKAAFPNNSLFDAEQETQ